MRTLLLLLMSCAAAAAQETSTAAAARFERFTLANGLQVILVPDRAVPVVTVAQIFPAGGRQEAPGRSGFAHLFEHLMFEGSAHVPKGGFDKMLEGYGADNNASTHLDFTFYYETLPSNALPVALWLDADRLSALDVSEKNMRNQIEVVKEEKRMRVDNEAYSPLLWIEVASRTFSGWANAHPTIGTFADLDAATLADVRAFFDEHYAPRDAWLALVGDFDPLLARPLVERYFGWIPNRGVPRPVDASESRQEGERRFELSDAHARLPGVAFVWNNMPERRSPDYYALALLGRLLCEGKSSRLYQLLVKEKQAATAIDEPFAGGLGFPVSDWAEYRAPGLFGLFVVHKASASAEQLREWVYAEAARIAAEGVPAAELDRVRTKFRSDWIVERQTTLGRAGALLRAAVLDGDPAASEGELERFMNVDAAAIQAAASKYLVPSAANVFVLKPTAKGEEGK